MNSILEKIFDSKRRRVSDAKHAGSVQEMRDRAEDVRRDASPHRFIASLQLRDRLSIIAEFKKSSPSKGVIDDSRDVSSIAAAYESGGAAAMSVLTEEDHFKGSLDDLRAARAAVSIPILRKDFTFDEFQIYEAAAAGADAILLIVASLTPRKLASLLAVAEEELKMDALVEVHSIEEMEVARSIGARLVGVNNRDLKSFNVSLDVSRRLVEHASSDAVLVSESGLRSREDLMNLRSIGYSAFLIGETLMRSDDPAVLLKDLMGVSDI
jgi:indole-3-glycerol phosphate synthase